MATIRKPVIVSKPATITPSIKKTTTTLTAKKTLKPDTITKKPQTISLPTTKVSLKSTASKVPSTKGLTDKPITNKSLGKPDVKTVSTKSSISQPVVLKGVADSTSSVKDSKTIKKPTVTSPAKTVQFNAKSAITSRSVTSVASKSKTSLSLSKTTIATKPSVTTKTVQPSNKLSSATSTTAKLAKATDVKLPKTSQLKTNTAVPSVSRISSKSVSNTSTLLKKSIGLVAKKTESKKPIGATKLAASVTKIPPKMAAAVKPRVVKSTIEQIKNVTKVCTDVQICDADSTSPTTSSDLETESAWAESAATESSTNFNEIQAYKVAEQIMEVMNTISGTGNVAEQNSFMKDSVVIDINALDDNADDYPLVSAENVENDENRVNELNEGIDEERLEVMNRDTEQIEAENDVNEETQIIEDLVESPNIVLEKSEEDNGEEILHENNEFHEVLEDEAELETENIISEEQIDQTAQKVQDSDELVDSENQPADENETEESTEIIEENTNLESIELSENEAIPSNEKYDDEDNSTKMDQIGDEEDVTEEQVIENEDEINDENNSFEVNNESVDECYENFQDTPVEDDREIEEHESEVVSETEGLENAVEGSDENIEIEEETANEVENLEESMNSMENEIGEEQNETEALLKSSEESFVADNTEVEEDSQTEIILVEEESTIFENEEGSLQMQENYFGENSKTLEFELVDNDCNSDGFIDLKSDKEYAEKTADNESIASTDSASYAEIVKQSPRTELLVDYFEDELEETIRDDNETTEIISDGEMHRSLITDTDTNVNLIAINEELGSEFGHQVHYQPLTPSDCTEQIENVFEEFTEEVQPELDANIEEHPSIDVEGYEKVQKKRNKRHNKRNRKSFRSFKNENTDQEPLTEIKENFSDDQTFFKRRNSRRNRHSMKKHYRRNSEPHQESQYYTVPVWRSFYHEY